MIPLNLHELFKYFVLVCFSDRVSIIRDEIFLLNLTREIIITLEIRRTSFGRNYPYMTYDQELR